ncbi:MAG: hypothetical protein LBJ64_11740 [Deltaproteobacteria bacterium]|jgi:hypothetical protein|nr:hypothetical protein [Deltaproteobacteria bacterium]
MSKNIFTCFLFLFLSLCLISTLQAQDAASDLVPASAEDGAPAADSQAIPAAEAAGTESAVEASADASEAQDDSATTAPEAANDASGSAPDAPEAQDDSATTAPEAANDVSGSAPDAPEAQGDAASTASEAANDDSGFALDAPEAQGDAASTAPGSESAPSLSSFANDDESPLTQADVDHFMAVYGRDEPSAAIVSESEQPRLALTASRLAAIYVYKGQYAEEAKLLAFLTALKTPVTLTTAEYRLYMSNEAAIKPIMEKRLGAYSRVFSDETSETSSVGEGTPPVSTVGAEVDESGSGLSSDAADSPSTSPSFEDATDSDDDSALTAEVAGDSEAGSVDGSGDLSQTEEAAEQSSDEVGQPEETGPLSDDGAEQPVAETSAAETPAGETSDDETTTSTE